MTYGGFTYGGAPYGSEAPAVTSGSTVALAPAVVDVVGATVGVKVGVRVDLQPAVVDIAAPTVTPGTFDDAYEAAVLALSPTIYWRLGEPSGTTAADETGNGYTGQYVNTPTLGATGLLNVGSDTAVTLASATAEMVYISSITSPTGPSQVGSVDKTVAVWVSTTDSDACLLYSAIRLYIDGTGKVRAETNGAEGAVTSAAAINDGSPHMVLATYTASTKTIELWVDGASEGTNTATNHPSTTTNFKVGTNQPNADYLDGTVDEAVLWNTTVIGDADVANLFATGGDATVTIDLAPAVVDLVTPLATITLAGITVDLQPAVIDITAPAVGSPSDPVTVTMQPAVVDLVAPRMPRRVSIAAWTADDAASTAFVMEVQIEVDTTYSDPTAESGWQPIRTNRVTWSSIEVDADTGRPVTPTTSVSVPLEPAVLELVGAAAEF